LLIKFKTVNFVIYIADRKPTTYKTYIGTVFLLGCGNPAALPLVRCYSIRILRMIASWVNYSMQRTESSSEHYVSDLSFLKADTLWCDISGARIWTHDPWIQKRVRYPLHHNAALPQDYFLTTGNVKLTRRISFKLIVPISRVDARADFFLVRIINDEIINASNIINLLKPIKLLL